MKAADPLRRDLKDYYGGNKWMWGNVALIQIEAAGKKDNDQICGAVLGINIQVFNSFVHKYHVIYSFVH